MEYLKFQTPSTKSQTNLKFQYQMTETGWSAGGGLVIGICWEFVICYLELLNLILQNSLLSFPAMFE